jgi:hypothetical protein
MRDAWLAINLALVFVLNLADYFLTARMIESGLVREVNPVMLRLFYWGPEYVFVLKMLSGILFVSYMWNLRKKRPRLVQIVTTAVLAFFVFLVTYLYLVLTYVRVIERLF